MQTWADRKQNLLKNLEQYRTLGDLRTIQIGADRQPTLSDTLTYCVKHSFSYKLSNFCIVLRDSRPIASPYFATREASALSPFERGLYLDYLFLSLDAADQALKKYRTTLITEEDELLPSLQKAQLKQLPLSNRIAFSTKEYPKHGTQPVATVYVSDLPYLQFFYGSSSTNFPWHRHKQTKASRKYSFHNLGQAFPLDCTDDKYTELLAWFLREKWMGINLSAEVSRYSPHNAKPLYHSSTLGNLWKKITSSDPNFLKELMSIPYPVYRVSYVQSMFHWWLSEDCLSDIGKLLRNRNPSDLMQDALCLPSSIQRKVACLPNEITMTNLDRLMTHAVDLSVCSCAEVYHGGSRIGGLGDILEDNHFWQTYLAILYNQICKELQLWNQNEASDYSFEKQMPLILLPSEDDHVRRLLQTLCKGDRISHSDSIEYTKIQQLCCQYNNI